MAVCVCVYHIAAVKDLLLLVNLRAFFNLCYSLVNTISVCFWIRTACLTRPPMPKPLLRASTPQTHSSAKQTNSCMQSYTRKVIAIISHTLDRRESWIILSMWDSGLPARFYAQVETRQREG